MNSRFLILGLVIATIFTVSITENLQFVDAFLSKSTAGWVYELNPGESQVLTWTLTNTDDVPINIEFRGEGPGSELFVFEELSTLEPKEKRSFEFIVVIPDDHPDNIEYRPTFFALEKAISDSEGGAAVVLINYQMSANPIVKIGDNPIFTPEPKPVKVEEKPVEEKPVEEEADFIATPTETLEEKLAKIQATNEANKVEEPSVTQTIPPKETMKQETTLDPEPSCGAGTEIVNGVCKVIKINEAEENGGGCLIATAAYGTELAPQVQFLREIRDNQLMNTEMGAAFMGSFNSLYYSFSPYIADMERESPIFKEAVKLVLTPMLSTLSIMTLVDEGSESQVLGLGISVITLNLSMYIGMPVFGIIKLHQLMKKI